MIDVKQCVSSNSQAIYERKEHVLLGISPFNSYFSENTIYALMLWAQRNFHRFNIFIPDILPIHTFLALGYDRTKAENKTKKQIAYLKNKIYRAGTKLGYAIDEIKKLLVLVSDLENNKAYIDIKKYCYDLWQVNENFHREVSNCTEWVVSGYVKEDQNVELSLAVYYLLDEMPIFLDTPSILNLSSSIFVYHQIPSFIRLIYNQTSFIQLSPKQGYTQVQVETQQEIRVDKII